MRSLGPRLSDFDASRSLYPRRSPLKCPYDQRAFNAAVTGRGAGRRRVSRGLVSRPAVAQAPVLKQLMSEPKLKSLTLFVANFDTEMALRKKLRRWSSRATIVVFNKGHEVAALDRRHRARPPRCAACRKPPQ